MSEGVTIDGYSYQNSKCGHMHSLLVPALLQELGACSGTKSVFDLGCGNGSVASKVAEAGYSVTGCDPSVTGIEKAKLSNPLLKIETGSGYEDLASRFGVFPMVYSLEVIEHVYDPRTVVRRVYDMLEPGGRFILSTPYHGYLKNLALALTGDMDKHFTALWDHGHIKFWSRNSITTLLQEAGFNVLKIRRLGRIPALAMTMMVVAQKPIGKA
ncbi:2-polyprenyl-6-hydroxyphenyl methylase/3-demethylubiquinone-9 3-methyltransferase [Prosthecobacter fusiformis]|uniref:2-polyprenyl-6-hydroxyphenyl methylase/3-demethylubiquinone-9 3-methyltransferase n=1 Tax=Prosthecobacter fusiformis TaxID=48464 RepID=A0A4R7RMB9_9BACT|nr:class I SAM-dependent methyltransferase [Prosthecobacter fusiformis]TDU64643.1 2-polyprenyl-6-hydroxyphenyl methylase/3-demethylubiquinone-9 3-methyltransferase [Prosthecobacter fusiformis]